MYGRSVIETFIPTLRKTRLKRLRRCDATVHELALSTTSDKIQHSLSRFSGCSENGKWPQSSSSRNLELLIPSWVISPTSGGMIGSCRPLMTSAGNLILERSIRSSRELLKDQAPDYSSWWSWDKCKPRWSPQNRPMVDGFRRASCAPPLVGGVFGPRLNTDRDSDRDQALR